MSACTISKRVTFDPMSFMYSNAANAVPKASVVTNFSKASRMSSRELKAKLTWQEANPKCNFFEGDSSDSSSDEFDFPETVGERAHRIYFARLRKQHYNEAANLALARKLISEEFSSQSVSSQENNDEEAGDHITECSMCMDESVSVIYPFFHQLDSSSVSASVDEAEAKDEPEPGFHPSHRCYEKLTRYAGQMAAAVSTESSPDRAADQPQGHTQYRTQDLPSDHIPDRVLANDFDELAENRTDVHRAMDRWMSMKHTRVMDKGRNWDLSQTRSSEEKEKDTKTRGITVPRGLL